MLGLLKKPVAPNDTAKKSSVKRKGRITSLGDFARDFIHHHLREHFQSHNRKSRSVPCCFRNQRTKNLLEPGRVN
ncbi:MAG: hypothetical protein ACK55I_46900, partial [bacterium]